MSDLIAFAFQDMLGPSPGNSHAVQHPSQVVRLNRHPRPPLQELPQPRQGPRRESITQLSGRGENRLPQQFQMLHLQAARSPTGIVLGTAEPGQTPSAVAGRPTPDGRRMHSKLLRHLLPSSASGQAENRTAGVTKIRFSRVGSGFPQLARVSLGQLEQTRSGHTRDGIPKLNYAQYLVQLT